MLDHNSKDLGVKEIRSTGRKDQDKPFDQDQDQGKSVGREGAANGQGVVVVIWKREERWEWSGQGWRDRQTEKDRLFRAL